MSADKNQDTVREKQQAMLDDFLGTCCEVNPALFVCASDLFLAYECFCAARGQQYTLSREALNESLRAKGLKQTRRNLDGLQVRIWEGIGLRPDGLPSEAWAIVPTRDFLQGILDYVSQQRFHYYGISRIADLLRVTADLLPHLEKDKHRPIVKCYGLPTDRGLKL